MRILIANPFGIGDVLFTLPLVDALRQQLPSGRIGFLANRRTSELVRHFPGVAWEMPFEFRAISKRSQIAGWNELRRVVRKIRSERFDLLIDLSLGWAAGCAAWAAGIPKRAGLQFRGRARFLTDPVPFNGFQVQAPADLYLDLLPRLGLKRPAGQAIRMRLPVPPSFREEAAAFLSSQGGRPGQPWIGIFPGGGATWGAQAAQKQWPVERFADLADRLAQRGELEILLLGDGPDADLCRQVAARMRRRARVLPPIPSLPLLAAVLEQARLILGNDSGPMHLAAAVGTHTVSIFGPVDGSLYGPPGAAADRSHRVVSTGLACRPCYRDFRFPPCPWDNGCLKQLGVEPAIRAAEELLEAG